MPEGYSPTFVEAQWYSWWEKQVRWIFLPWNEINYNNLTYTNSNNKLNKVKVFNIFIIFK